MSIQFQTGQEFLQAITRNVRQPELLAEAFEQQAYVSKARFNELFTMLLGILQEINRSYQTVATKFMRCVYSMTEMIVRREMFFRACSEQYIDQLIQILSGMMQKPSEPRISDQQEISLRIVNYLEENKSQSSSCTGSSFRMNTNQKLVLERLIRVYALSEVAQVTSQQVLLELKTRASDSPQAGELLAQYLMGVYTRSGELSVVFYIAERFLRRCVKQNYVQTLRGFNANFLGNFPLQLDGDPALLDAFLRNALDVYASFIVDDEAPRVEHAIVPELLAHLFMGARTSKANALIRGAMQNHCTIYFQRYVRFLFLHKAHVLPMYLDQFFKLAAPAVKCLGPNLCLRLLKQLPCVQLSQQFILRTLQEKRWPAQNIQYIMQQEFPRYVSFLFFSDPEVAADALHMAQQFVGASLGGERLAQPLMCVLRELLDFQGNEAARMAAWVFDPQQIKLEDIQLESLKKTLFHLSTAALNGPQLAQITNMIQPPFQDYYMFFYLNKSIANKLLFILSQRLTAVECQDTLRLFYWASYWAPEAQPIELVQNLVQSGVFPTALYFYLAHVLILSKVTYDEASKITTDPQFNHVLREARMLFRE